MPGFIENVQGRELLFKILEGVIGTANPLRIGSTENALPGWLQSLSVAIVRFKLLFFGTPGWTSLALGVRRKEELSALNPRSKYSCCSLNF